MERKIYTMSQKFVKIYNEHPKFRRFIDAISDFGDKMLVVNYIILSACLAVLIGAPTIAAFLSCPEDIRVWIASIVGGILSLVVMPLFINYIKYKQNKADRLYKINKPLYEKLSAVLIKLLADEYIIHGKNAKNEINTAADNDKVEKIVNPLKCFICENYDKMCNTFSVSLIWDIVDVYNECLNNNTKYSNIRAKVRKCFRNMRKNPGAKGWFYINQDAITMLCSDNNE